MLIASIITLLLKLVHTTVSETSSSVFECSVPFGETSTSAGVQKTTFGNVSYCAYLGVRYAEAPIGERRFQPPVLHAPSGHEVYITHGNICPQLDDINFPTAVLGDEDCLFINIFTPMIDRRELPVNLFPILVFIHGGSFTAGSAGYDMAGVDLLIESQIVVISINYRVDVLGFLSFPPFNITGNYGLKDQLTALQWIHRYIKFFGGDPDKVTLMGQSAGAISVNYHMYSDQSKGLFQQAALLSGNFLVPWAFSYDPEKYSKYYFGHLGISTREELMSRDFRKLFFLNETTRMFGIVFASMQFPCFIPVNESSSDPDAFFTAPPHEWIVQKPIHDIPLLVGRTSTEFELLLNYVQDYFYWDENFPNRKNKTLLSYIESAIRVMANDTKMRGQVKDQPEFFRIIANFANIVFPQEQFLEQIFKKGQTAPVYVYRFEYDGKFGWYKNKFYPEKRLDKTRYGAIHGDDLGYIFTPHNVDCALASPDEFEHEWKIHRQMVSMVSNFVKHGNPSSRDLEWTVYDSRPGHRHYMNIDRLFEMKIEADTKSYYFELWESVHNCYYYYNCT